MTLSLIAAYAYSESQKKFVIGKDNRLPWNCPEDLKRFKDLTSGHTVIMGRKTFESIGKVLPDRMNYVVTRQKDYKAPKDKNLRVLHSVGEALHYAGLSSSSSETFVIGGEEIYKQTMSYADRLYITEFNNPEIEGDAFFPLFNYEDFSYIYLEKKKDHLFQILSRSPLTFMREGKQWTLTPKDFTE